MPIYLQTVWEGYQTNTYEGGLAYLQGSPHNIEDPFYGYVAGDNLAIFNQYHSDQGAGTPYTVIIDKYGEPVTHNFSTLYNQQNLINVIEGILADQ